MPRSEATVTFGAIALVTGFVGTFAGGWLGDFFLKRSKQSYLWVSGIATLIAAPAAFIAVSNPHRSVYLPAIAIAEVLIFMCTGPVNSAIINAVKPGERATAVGLSVLVMHLVGDIPSPPLIGAISDHHSLERAFMLVPLAIVIAGCIWMYAAWLRRRTMSAQRTFHKDRQRHKETLCVLVSLWSSKVLPDNTMRRFVTPSSASSRARSSAASKSSDGRRCRAGR